LSETDRAKFENIKVHPVAELFPMLEPGKMPYNDLDEAISCYGQTKRPVPTLTVEEQFRNWWPKCLDRFAVADHAEVLRLIKNWRPSK
jgi:hypothetical protein